ncbi:MAG: hypothetical protein Ct9H90mP13_09050 [Pseudomonadota bacterium]|nr:MAG: hypothetical protein Ct9H90mP13_09050 [Pseudomonadota bacterium]
MALGRFAERFVRIKNRVDFIKYCATGGVMSKGTKLTTDSTHLMK